MDIEKVRELVKLVEESGIAELEVTNGETTVRICKTGAAAPVAPPAPPPMAAVTPNAAPPPPATPTPGWRDVTSPIVGTFYRSPAPGSEAFVSVGSRVTAGQTLCIIEAMKVMNEIEAEFGGTVREILAVDGGPVEAEAVLFRIEP